MTIFIMNWNWLEWTKKQAEFYTSCGHTVIIVDNLSTYPPLLEWYKICPYQVISTKGRKLPTHNRFVWNMKLENIVDGNYYAVTDSDLGVEGVPRNFAELLIADIERNPEILKSGFSLQTHDLPNNEYANLYKDSEKENFPTPDAHGFYNVQIDTTFAVYSKERCNNIDKMWRKEGEEVPQSFLDDRYFYRSHRSPFTVKHLPWYLDVNNLTEEQLYHISEAVYGSLFNFKQIYAKQLKNKLCKK